jgi:hypothetical protein
MHGLLRNARLTLPGLFCLLLVACSDGSDQVVTTPPVPEPPPWTAISAPTVEQPPETGTIFLESVTFDLGDVGYAEAEFFLSGSASAFTNLSELDEDGNWSVEVGETADYRTRLVVYRPIDPADFSGTVILEWLNVSSGFDIPPSFGAGHTEILRSGHAWVGVSAQLVGIEGSDRALLPLHLKAVDPERYGSLLHPGDSFSYDIFSQALRSLRDPGDIDPLDGLPAETFLAFGQSQSATRLMTYINALHPLYAAFDGYMIHSRGNGSSPLAQEPQVPIPAPGSVRIRTDLEVPVFTFQAETDLLLLGFISDRQPDSDRFRLWEVAGTAHTDYYITVAGRADKGADPQYAVMREESSVLGYIQCEKPMNAGPQTWVFNTAVNALVAWVRDGTPPPEADRLATNDAGTAFAKDDLGNVLGGVRTPYVDAPAAVLSGEGQQGGGFCLLFGTTDLFDAAQMAALYVDRDGYIAAVSEAADDAVARGFLLAADAERIKAAAGLQWDLLAP